MNPLLTLRCQIGTRVWRGSQRVGR